MINKIKTVKINDNKINVYGNIETPLFLAKDVAKWIDIKNVSDMVKAIDEEERELLSIQSRLGVQARKQWCLTEYGVYEVLMQSRKPKAREFKSYVKNILKDIRVNGLYIAEGTTDEEIEQYKKFGQRRVKRGFIASVDKRNYANECLEYHKKDTVEYVKAIKIMLKEIKRVDLTTLRGSEIMAYSELTIDLLKLKNERENRSKGALLGIRNKDIKQLKGRCM